MDMKHLGISSALLCLPEPGWTRPCSAPHRVAQCLFTPGGVSKPPRHRLTSGSRGKPGKPCPSPSLSPEACRRAMSGSQHQHSALGSERQSWPHGSQAKALVGPVCQRCSGRLGQPGLLKEAGSSFALGRGGGSRQQPQKPEQKEATSLGQLCSLVRNRVARPCSSRATSASAVLGAWANYAWGCHWAHKVLGKKREHLAPPAVGGMAWKSHGAAGEQRWGERDRWSLKGVVTELITAWRRCSSSGSSCMGCDFSWAFRDSVCSRGQKSPCYIHAGGRALLSLYRGWGWLSNTERAQVALGRLCGGHCANSQHGSLCSKGFALQMGPLVKK